MGNTACGVRLCFMVVTRLIYQCRERLCAMCTYLKRASTSMYALLKYTTLWHCQVRQISLAEQL